MGITERLEELRVNFPECRIAAFADLSAKTILTYSASSKPRQEELDALCAAAADLLNGDLAQQLIRTVPDAKAVEEVASQTGSQMTVALRLTNAPDEALCCLCAPEIDLGAFSGRARRAMASGDFRQ